MVVPSTAVPRMQVRGAGPAPIVAINNRAHNAVKAVGADIVASANTASLMPPRKRQSQPGLPVPKPTISTSCKDGMLTNVASNDVYVALWDCSAGAANELSFNAGDRLLIVSRQYEEFGWWVGQLLGLHDGPTKATQDGDLIGLVPKEYLRKS